jgi:hypothetical protein
MSYSYARTAAHEVRAGRNGRLILDGQLNGPKSSGTILYARPITMSPIFRGRDVDAAIAIGERFLDTILREMIRQVPNLKTVFAESYMGNSNNLGYEATAKCTWVGDGDALIEAMNAQSDRLGFTLTNWINQ